MKLVRDKIPELFGGKTKKAEDSEYLKELAKKLQEEVDEFKKDGKIEELADIMEVIYAIVDHLGISKERLEEIRMKKKEERGGFKEKLMWEK